MDKVTLVEYIDDKYDYYRLKGAETEFLLSGTGQNVTRCDVVLTEAAAEDLRLERYDLASSAQLLSIKNVMTGKKTVYRGDGSKAEPLYMHAAQILKQLCLGDFTERLSERADRQEAEKIFSKILGKKVFLAAEMNVGSTARALLTAIGKSASAHVLDRAAENGIFLSTERKTVWFHEETAQLQVIGLYRETTFEEAPLCNDELCGICYNLLLVRIGDERCMVRLAKESSEFAERVTASYERSLVFPYYEDTKIVIRKKRFYDLDGKPMTGFYVPGAMMNHAYINEYTTTDNMHYVFCALFDRHLRKWGRGIPVLYNDETGETVQLHDRMNMRAYGMLMSKQNKVYFVADENIYCYDIYTREKKVVFTEPNGCSLQEVPTISDDGRYLLFFYGTRQQHIPNRGCVLDTQSGTCKIILDYPWVDEHFGHQHNPFAGHFIINPKRPWLINFLHGGPDNVKDRMWLLNTETEEKWEPYRQVILEDGSFGESLTHWVWSPDGNRLYFVRVRRDMHPSVGQGGICYIEPDQPQKGVTEMVTQKEAIHAVPDCSGKLFVYDTYNDEPEKYRYTSEISLFHMETGEEKLLHRISIIKNHPGHPHPVFSADGSLVIFAFSAENSGVVCVCVERVG